MSALYCTLNRELIFLRIFTVRIISNTLCEFLHRVPDATVDIFKIGSCTAGAMLVGTLLQRTNAL